MRGTVKYTLYIYLCIFLLTIPTVTQENVPQTTTTELKIEKLTQFISTKYNVSDTAVKKVVEYAHRQGDKVFPTPIDILSIIAIESSFNKYAVSKARAKGYMQVLYKETTFDIRTNINDGTHLLREYSRVMPKDAAVQAYNVGIGNYKKGMRNTEYLAKFKQTKQQLESI